MLLGLPDPLPFLASTAALSSKVAGVGINVLWLLLGWEIACT
jgi:hypothetical protein